MNKLLITLALALSLPFSAEAQQTPSPGLAQTQAKTAPATQTVGQPPLPSAESARPDNLDHLDSLLSKGGRVSDPLPPADYLSRTAVPLTAKERHAINLAASWEAQGAPPIQANGKIMYTYGASYPTVIGVPHLICDIELQPGENINEVVIGDSARWIADTAKSGDTTHVLLKPMDAGLMTSAVITTDRRVYHLKLISQRTGLTPYVGFLYPDGGSGLGGSSLREKLSVAKDAREKEQQMKSLEPASDPSTLNFAYDIKGKTSWKPLQVYDDGKQMFINFPPSIQSGDAPVLLVRNGGEDTMANFRMKESSMIVDGVFPEAILISGVGSKQQRITIRKQ
ncbi:MAG: P-type conjugative transfer protein TrbG [Desulfovibrionaceae bacterium]|nr:P-type conjugative transfer protein TrbG [Desulfovibrionaceae bacterium]